MKLTIWGAARQVTGSMHLLQLDNYNILIDCGLDYERDTYQDENENFPFLPSDIDVVILTHAPQIPSVLMWVNCQNDLYEHGLK